MCGDFFLNVDEMLCFQLRPLKVTKKLNIIRGREKRRLLRVG